MKKHTETNMQIGANNDIFNGLGIAYTKAYATCYIISPLFGFYSPLVGYIPSAIFLISVGIGLWMGVKYRNKSLLWILAVGEAMACVGHYLQVIPWSPTFSDLAYINMAILDLIQSMCLFKLLNHH